MRWDRESWVKLYRREQGSFALLSLYARSLAAELLKFVDDDGRLFVGKREPWEAIAKVAGATAGDRRMLRKNVADLLEDGYLALDGDHLVIRNMAKAQGRGRESSAKRNEPSANGARAGANPTRTDDEPERTEYEPCTKNELSDCNHSEPPLAGARASEDPIREDPIRQDPELSHSAGVSEAGDVDRDIKPENIPPSSPPGPPERVIELDQPGSSPKDDLLTFLGTLRDDGHPWATKVWTGLLSQGGRLTPGQRETLGKIRGELAEARAAPLAAPRGRARPRDHQVQGGPSFIAEVRAAAENYEPIGDEIL
jgi:hypothetical protein